MEDVQTVIRDDVTVTRSRLNRMPSGVVSGAPLIDIGTTSLTGLRAAAFPRLGRDRVVAHPVHVTLALDPADCLGLGSDFVRTGLLFSRPEITDDECVDAFGVHWLSHEGALSPLRHPLETADPKDVAHHPRPQWLQPVQCIKTETAKCSIVIADAPCPGLLDLCFMMRNTWQFMEDVTVSWRTASALLEWSMETIVQAYAYMLGTLPVQPDIIVYSDDLGFDDTMFFSPSDFRTYLRPWLRILLARLRGLTSAAICFHCCGAIGPILSDIADLGVEIVNLDTNAKGMAIRHICRTLPASLVLHGSNDLCALGAAVANQDKAGVASLITELAHSAPVVAGPMDSLSSIEEVLDAMRGAAFIRNLSDDDFDCLRRIGPVRSIIEEALEKTLSAPPPAIEPTTVHRRSGERPLRNQLSLPGRR